MKNSWHIFSKDVKNIITNWVVIVLIGGLTLLPSLYAWFNIKASWDPYGQTDEIPIGIVNEDSGATVRDEEIHVGDELVKTLKDNKSMNWQFIDRDQAMEKVEYGDYYAVLVIPENFSKQLATVINDHPEKATVEYYVNEKINAIAPKITQKGASTIVEQVNSKFIATVNGVIFDMFNEIGLELEKDLPDIERFEDYIFTIEEKLPEINKLLNETHADANNAQEIIAKAKQILPEASKATNNGLETIDETTSFLKQAENRLDKMAPKVKSDLKKVQSIAKEANDFLQTVEAKTINFDQGKQLADDLTTKSSEAIETIETIETALQQLQQQQQKLPENAPDKVNNETIDQTLAELAVIKGDLWQVHDDTDKLTSFIDEKSGDINTFIANLKEITANTSANIDAFVTEYNENIEPTVRQEVNKAKGTLTSARSILVEIKDTLPEVDQILKRTDKNLDEGKETLEYVLGEFPYVNDKVNELAKKIRDIQAEADINDIIQLLQNDPEAERGFFAEPVKLNENKLFPIENYGTGMTPFYTVLAIWVGGLLLISLLSTDVHNWGEFTGRQMYFGRMYTFLCIGLLQTLIVTIGDMVLIGVTVAEPFWFVLFGVFCSLIFVLIVYTLVSVFGDVGKATAIILLVLQIAGAGGTYPVVLLPSFFQAINPFLPFTYAIDLMREAVGGIVWNRVYRDLLFLAIFGVIIVLLGAFLKEPISKQTSKLKEKSKESGLFH